MLAGSWGALLAGVAWAGASDHEAHFTLQPRVVVDLAHDRPLEDVAESWTFLRANAKGPARTGRWFLEVQADYAVLVGADAATDVEAAANVWMGESGWAGSFGKLHVRTGYLVDRWGTLELLPVTDILNGRDLRAGPLIPLEHSRVPAPMVRLETGTDALRVGLVALPFGARSRVPFWGTDYSLLKQGMVEGLAADAATWSDDPLLASTYNTLLTGVSEGIAALDAQSRRGLETALSETGAPRPLLEAGELALEVQSRVGPVDLAATGAWIRSRVPAPQLDPQLQNALITKTLPGAADVATADELSLSTVSSERPRTWTAGVAAQTLVGGFGLRAEGNYAHTTVVPTPWLGYVLSPLWTVGAGFDYARSTSLTLLAEGRWRHLSAPPLDAQMVGIPDQFELATGIRSTFARERVTAELGGLVDLTFAEVAAQPSVRFRATDTLDFGAGAIVLLGPTPAAVTWEDAMDYSGGLIGYSSDTDSAWVDLRWLR